MRKVGDFIVEKLEKFLWAKQPPPEPTQEEKELFEDWVKSEKEKVSGVKRGGVFSMDYTS